MTLGEKIKKLRTEHKMTQAELADKLYVTRQAITNYERNANMPSIDVIKSMAEIFNVDLKYLLEVDSESINEESKVKNKDKIVLTFMFLFPFAVSLLLRRKSFLCLLALLFMTILAPLSATMAVFEPIFRVSDIK